HELIVVKRIDTAFPASIRYEQDEEGVRAVLDVEAKKGVSYGFDQYAIVGLDQSEADLDEALERTSRIGFDALFSRNERNWDQLWDRADVRIEGDEKAQFALRYSLYHLLILTPTVRADGSIPARGISGQTYKGAVFWDTEMFILPFFLNTDHKSAKRLIHYRIDTLAGALKKAASYGFKGAFYPWESQEGGYDACTDYNVTDAWDRPLRTHFKDKQIHISAAVVYAMMAYIRQTGDEGILKEGGLAVLIEVARFYLDRGQYAVLRDRFEFWDVMGPDEYHERVRNNAFTDRMVKFVFYTVLSLKKRFADRKDDYFPRVVAERSFENELALIERFLDRIRIKKPDERGIIEQFDGYFSLKDISIEEVFERRVHRNEYLGIPALAGDTQIIKQADVVMMLDLFGDDYSLDIKRANFDYYAERTEHGSTLSASMYGLLACRIGEPDRAYSLFIRSASVDLEGAAKRYAGSIDIGGTHPAAAGGAYMVAIFGFAGLRLDGDRPVVNPCLPKSIESMRFTVKYRTRTYRIHITKDSQRIEEI
ncbi:MAG: glycosyl hydrolase family 65 protein, partial [Acholeplasmataceae bacterium]